MRTTYPQPRYNRPARRLFHGVIAALAVGVLVLVAEAPQASATSSYWTFPPSFSSTYTLSSGFAAYGVVMNAYGTIMYALTNYSGSSYRVEEYVLTTPWNLATANYLKSKNISVTNTPKLTFLTEDGTKMFISEGGNWVIHKYTMSTPWDVNTLSATQDGSPCGNQYLYGSSFALGGTHEVTYCGDGTTKSRDLTTAWDLKSGANSKSIDFGAGNRPEEMSWSPTGTELLGDVPNHSSTIDEFVQYSCTTAYDISTCSINASDVYDYSTTYGQGDQYNGFWPSLDANYIVQVTHAHQTIVNAFAIGTGTTWTYTGTFPASGSYSFPSIPPASQSWIGTIIYPIGKFFSDVMQYLFIPSSTELNYWTQLQTLAAARAPFSYVSQIQTIFSTAPASSSAFPTLSFNLKPTFGIHASISLMSTSMLNTYFNGSVKALFQYMIIFACWLLFGFHVWRTVLTII